MKYYNSLTILALTLFLLTSCGSKKDVVYFQDIDLSSASKAIKGYNSILKSDDILSITVSAQDQDVVRSFNLPAVTFVDESGAVGRTTQQTYLVDSNGNIDFPVLGKIKLAGLNRVQATELIENRLTTYIKEPIVNIRRLNFRVTVLGEVNRPGVYTFPNERVTILEALGRAGDITIQGERDNILLVREVNGQKSYNRLNITSETLFNSPYYYLTQNDFIYVTPNNSRIKSSGVGPDTRTTISIIGTLITAAALVVSITR